MSELRLTNEGIALFESEEGGIYPALPVYRIAGWCTGVHRPDPPGCTCSDVSDARQAGIYKKL